MKSQQVRTHREVMASKIYDLVANKREANELKRRLIELRLQEEVLLRRAQHAAQRAGYNPAQIAEIAQIYNNNPARRPSVGHMARTLESFPSYSEEPIRAASLKDVLLEPKLPITAYFDPNAYNLTLSTGFGKTRAFLLHGDCRQTILRKGPASEVPNGGGSEKKRKPS